MRTKFFLAVPVLLLVAAGPTLPIRPGKWQTTVTVDAMSMPGMPPAMVKRMAGNTTTVSSCITPAQAADGPRALVDNTKGRCHFTRFTATGGRFDAAMACAMGSGTMTATSTGTYTTTTLSVSSSGSMTGAHGMTTKSHSSGHYVGPC